MNVCASKSDEWRKQAEEEYGLCMRRCFPSPRFPSDPLAFPRGAASVTTQGTSPPSRRLSPCASRTGMEPKEEARSFPVFYLSCRSPSVGKQTSTNQGGHVIRWEPVFSTLGEWMTYRPWTIPGSGGHDSYMQHVVQNRVLIGEKASRCCPP